MTPFYYDPDIYDLMVDPLKRNDIPFWVGQSKPFKGAILELFCGTGQIAQALAASGKSVTGVDLSSGLVQFARKKAKRAKLNIGYEVQDVLSLDFKGWEFEFVYAPMGSMAHLVRVAELKRFFTSVKKSLRPGGIFAIDVPNPNLNFLTRVKDDRFLISRYQDKKAKCEVIVEETGYYDPVRQINHLVWHQRFSNGKCGESHELKLRVFYPEELKLLIESNGFKLLRRYGDYQGRPFRGTSPRQIVFCREK